LYWNVVESFIIEKMSEYKMPGLSITVVRGSEVVYSRGFGYRDLDVLAPATPATIYGIGSITKSFTALSILMLAERGSWTFTTLSIPLNGFCIITVHVHYGNLSTPLNGFYSIKPPGGGSIYMV